MTIYQQDTASVTIVNGIKPLLRASYEARLSVYESKRKIGRIDPGERLSIVVEPGKVYNFSVRRAPLAFSDQVEVQLNPGEHIAIMFQPALFSSNKRQLLSLIINPFKVLRGEVYRLGEEPAINLDGLSEARTKIRKLVLWEAILAGLGSIVMIIAGSISMLWLMIPGLLLMLLGAIIASRSLKYFK